MQHFIYQVVMLRVFIRKQEGSPCLGSAGCTLLQSFVLAALAVLLTFFFFFLRVMKWKVLPSGGLLNRGMIKFCW